MKRLLNYFLFSIASAALLSCEDESNSVKKTEYRPLRIEEVAYKRELIYNEAGQVAEIISESEMPDKEIISTVQEFEYNSDGKIVSSRIDNERLYQYSYEAGQVVKTEELLNGIALNRFVFSYQTNGLVKEMMIYQYENGDVTLRGKINYAFDVNSNVSSVKEFSYDAPGFALELIYEFDRYDNFPSADSHFDFHTLNPALQLHKNNPGKMVSINKNGVTFSIEDYVYDYNDKGYPVKRESTITFLHIGSTGSYTTHYFFEEM
jgi:hypothetical protein